MTPSDLNNLSHSLIKEALAVGADSADAIAIQGTSVSVDVRNGALNKQSVLKVSTLVYEFL